MWHVYIKIWIDCLIRFFNLDFNLFLIMHTFILIINVIVNKCCSVEIIWILIVN
ncbi:hypothetical protein ACS0TY_015348 [Phlomoides rotata]